VDAYSFGILIYEVSNGGFLGTDQLTLPKQVPVTMQPSYKRLISANPKVRLSTAQFLEQGLRSGGFFETPLIHLTDGIENLGLKSDEEREELLRLVHGRSTSSFLTNQTTVSLRAYLMISPKTFSK
jgi:SCY1-like protein 1